MHSKAVVAALGVVGTLVLGGLVWAKDDAGSVVSLRGGTLERLEKKGWKEIPQGAKLAPGDRLRTGKGAVAVLEYPAVGRFVMGPASEVEMGREPKDFSSKMNRGALWMQAKLPLGGRAGVTTPIATAGVRGTSFAMVFGEGEKTVCACTCKGDIEVTAQDGTKVMVPKGSYVAVDQGKPAPAAAQPSAPALAQQGGVFGFCLSCHVAGSQGALKADWNR
jgi:hypothetical protein